MQLGAQVGAFLGAGRSMIFTAGAELIPVFRILDRSSRTAGVLKVACVPFVAGYSVANILTTLVQDRRNDSGSPWIDIFCAPSTSSAEEA